jgi:hypothetical protein
MRKWRHGSTILELGTRHPQVYAPPALPPEKRPRFKLDACHGGRQIWSGRYEE